MGEVDDEEEDALAIPPVPEGRGYQMRGRGRTEVPIAPEALWAIVMDEKRLAAAIPGAETLRRVDEGGMRVYEADVGIGVARFRGTYLVRGAFAEAEPFERIVLFGGARGPFGRSNGQGRVRFERVDEGTRITYAYGLLITGVVAKLGGSLLDAAADRLIAKFFARLARAVEAMPEA